MKNLILSLLVVVAALGASAYKNAPEKTLDLKGAKTLPQGYLVQTAEGIYEYRSSDVANDGTCLFVSANPCKYVVPANNNIPVQGNYSANEAALLNLSQVTPNKLWTE